jgi:hypothetical protein
MEWVLVPLAGIALTGFIVWKIMDYLRLKATVSGSGKGTGTPEMGRLEARLEEIERRLTDVQDVMIALSEKFDRWEAERTKV